MSSRKKIIVQGIIAILIIIVGATGFTKLKSGKKALERHKTEVPLPLVRTVIVTTDPMQIFLAGQGTVKPVQEIQLGVV